MNPYSWKKHWMACSNIAKTRCQKTFSKQESKSSRSSSRNGKKKALSIFWLNIRRADRKYKSFGASFLWLKSICKVRSRDLELLKSKKASIKLNKMIRWTKVKWCWLIIWRQIIKVFWLILKKARFRKIENWLLSIIRKRGRWFAWRLDKILKIWKIWMLRLLMMINRRQRGRFLKDKVLIHLIAWEL